VKKFVGVTFLSFAFMGLLCGIAFGESYPNGSEGIKGAALPPPGLYFKMYNGYTTADKLLDQNGDKIPLDFEIKWFTNVSRLIWISDIKILDAYFGMDFIVPVWHRDTKIGAFGVDDREWALGDIILEPFILTWHRDQYIAAAAVSFFLPTGEHDTWADPGEDMYTTMFTASLNYYFDKAKTWSFSWVGRYEIHCRKRDGNKALASIGLSDGDVKPGDDFHFEWGIGKTLNKVWDVGVAGYCQWQLEEDKGMNAPSGKDQAYAIGPEVGLFYPPWQTLFQLRILWDFDVEGRSNGRPKTNRTFFVITKVF